MSGLNWSRRPREQEGPQTDRDDACRHHISFSGSASATSPHPAFSKEDQERKYQGRKQQGSPAPGSPIPDSAQAWSLSSDSWVDRQQQSSTPTKPRKDLYDNERTFGRTGSVNVKKAALAAGGRLSLGPTARDEETPRSRSRRIVHDAVANAVSKAELTVHLESVSARSSPPISCRAVLDDG